MDNTKIHAYPELLEGIHQCDARIIFLPLYCPQLNTIDPCFELLKRWLQMHANLVSFVFRSCS
ncbi:Transposase [Phytophthora megakarya]|uniref:Transposase n=1 Tax=Phytophthora megakarya TaxID=4795 RepID=A0A225VFY8_9STRA|nr:Transposase [Phytophthora megakarya]